MNRKIFLIAAVMFLIIGISAVCAEDINQTDDNLKTIDSDVISVDEPANKSFTNLLNDIENSGDTLDLTSDYKFNTSTDGDLTEGIGITLSGNEPYTINGNNHVIDADNKAGVLKFRDGVVILNNLKIINANMSSIVLYNCELQTNNVTFENNHDPATGAAIYAKESNYYSNHDKFLNYLNFFLEVEDSYFTG